MNILKKYFTIWWIPIITYLIPIAIYFIATFLKNDNLIDLALILFYLNILGTLISCVVQIIIKKWYFIFFQIITSLLLFFYVSMLFTFSPPDYYGTNKNIPIGIKVETPIEKKLTEKDLSDDNFTLASISQPGIYTYYTTYQPKERGFFYIKAFEITTNDRLSEDRISKQSVIKVENFDAKIYSQQFTIYEGSWGDKYSARIELWFKPESGNREYKIREKNYIVEGWMR